MGLELLVAIRAHEEQRAARGLAREVVHELRARVVGPLQFVDHHHDLAPAGQGLEELHHRAEAGAPGAPRESQPTRVGTATALGQRAGTSAAISASDTGASFASASCDASSSACAGEVDDGLVRHRALDLVAVRGERAANRAPRIAGDSCISRLLPMPGSPSISTTWPDPGGQPREQPDEQAVLVAATDEGGRLSVAVEPLRRSVEWDLVNLQRSAGAHGARRLEKRVALLLGNGRASAASRSARRREGRRSSASILRIAKREQLTVWASASWVRSSALRRRRSQYPKL